MAEGLQITIYSQHGLRTETGKDSSMLVGQVTDLDW